MIVEVQRLRVDPVIRDAHEVAPRACGLVGLRIGARCRDRRQRQDRRATDDKLSRPHSFRVAYPVSDRILAAVMTAPRQPIEIREFERPDLPPGAALLRTARSEVCGTDVHLWHGRLSGVPYPI